MKVYRGGERELLGTAQSIDDDELLVLALQPGSYLVRRARFSGGTANYDLSIVIDQ